MMQMMIIKKIIETFEVIYDKCIPLKECIVNKKKGPPSPWITKGLLKVLIRKINCIKSILGIRPMETYKV